MACRKTTVYALAQDSAGFIYAGTEEGVARYDGRRWQRVPYPANIAAQRPFANVLAATPDGAIWVGTDNAGLLRYADGVMQPRVLKGDAAASDIEAMLVDGKRLWVGTSRGLFNRDANNCDEVPAARGLQIAALLMAVGARADAGTGHRACRPGAVSRQGKRSRLHFRCVCRRLARGRRRALESP